MRVEKHDEQRNRTDRYLSAVVLLIKNKLYDVAREITEVHVSEWNLKDRAFLINLIGWDEYETLYCNTDRDLAVIFKLVVESFILNDEIRAVVGKYLSANLLHRVRRILHTDNECSELYGVTCAFFIKAELSGECQTPREAR